MLLETVAVNLQYVYNEKVLWMNIVGNRKNAFDSLNRLDRMKMNIEMKISQF